MSWYCTYAADNPVHASYHDGEYGFPLDDERLLFERLCLEVMQCGLSWDLILRRRAGMNEAFHGFDADRVAAYDDADVARLLADARIIRNRLKVRAVINNARTVQGLRDSHGGFAGWIAAHHPLRHAQWVKVFRKTFAFTGPEVVNEFLMSIGMLPGSHHEDCPVQARLVAARAPWMAARDSGFTYSDGEQT